MSARLSLASKVFVYAATVSALSCSQKSNGPDLTLGTGGFPTMGGGAGGAAAGAEVGGSTTLAGMSSINIPTPPAGGMPGMSGGGTSGSGGGDAMGGRTVTQKCATSMATSKDVMTVRPADIIFAIDSSSSMSEEIDEVQRNMNAFSEQIVATGIDVRVILLGDPRSMCIGAPLGSGQCDPIEQLGFNPPAPPMRPPLDTNPPRYVHVPVRVASNDALSVIVSTYDLWKEHLRPNATKSFVVVTDDDARPPTTAAETFKTALPGLDPMMFEQWSMNGVYCFTQCMGIAAAVGSVYSQLVMDTNGVAGDLCTQNFQPVFDQLAKQIIEVSGSEIACEWELPPAPAEQSFSAELVQVNRKSAMATTPLSRVASEASCEQGGWYFDSALNPTEIRACPSTCMDMQNETGGAIDIVFGCEEVGGCIESGGSTVGTGAQGTCEWELPEPPEGQLLDFSSVNVRYTSPSGFATNLGFVPSGDECAMFEQGWHYDDAMKPKKIVACPQTCTEIQAGGDAAKVDVLFGCKSKPAVVPR